MNEKGEDMVHLIGMLPIRKVKPTQVALTSYYNKTFIDRSTRAVNDYGRWITRNITTVGLDDEDQRIENIKLSNVFDQAHTVPRVYSMIARRIARFDSHGNHFYFDFAKRITYFNDKVGIDVTSVEKGGWIVVGHRGDLPILMDMNNTLYINDEVLGDIPSVTGIDPAKAPLEIIEMSVSNKTIPVGMVLAYHMGLSGLLDLLGCEVTRFRRGERFALQSDEYALTFQDEMLVFTRQDVTSMMILGGLQRFHKSLNSYSVWDFDAKDVYLNVMEENGLGVRYLREIDTLFPAWIDPITKGLLEDMNEPTTFTGLLLRATEMLHTDFSPSEVDGAYMRYRGYERFAGMVYGELTRAAKLHNARSGNDGVLDLNPHQVWQRVVQDPSVTLCEDINPIQNLREQEVMTYRGDGGRGGKSMVERTRIYSDADLGVVSESTQDSGDVGVVAYLSPDPNLTSLRGETRRYNPETDGTSKLLSSSALNAPCMENDDGKRIAFISIQAQQGIFADGYTPTPLRTGYEQTISDRTTDLFAATADEDGVVTDVTKRSIKVTYKSGETVSVELGKRFGSAAGLTFPHEIVTELKKGDKVKYGDTLAYNHKFFAVDDFNPGAVVWKAGVMVKTALIDDIDTLEDGSSISAETAKNLTTQTTEIRNVEIRFDQYIYDLVKVGDHLDLDSILCTIEDPETAENPLFDTIAADTLKRLTAMTPRAKTTGTVSKIDCFYHGEFEDLSPNLQTIAEGANKTRRLNAKALGQPSYDGQVDTSFRVKGNALDPDVLVIQIYIDHNVSCNKGDKGVFANQLKTTFSRVFHGVNRTASGEHLDAKFGKTSIQDRMVLSPEKMGTTNTLLRVLSHHIADVYRGKTDAKRDQS